MATKLPYVTQPGGVAKIFEKIKHAQTPDRFTQDFLHTKLGFKGGNHRQFIPLAKKLGFLGSDGKPTEIYKKFRNDSTSKAAMAEAIKTGFQEVFARNEYANNLSKDQLKGLVVEITGAESDSRVAQLTVQTIEVLKKLADFDAKIGKVEKENEPNSEENGELEKDEKSPRKFRNDLDLNLSYTINLVLPKTDDPAVFSAIFKSLRENLLRK